MYGTTPKPGAPAAFSVWCLRKGLNLPMQLSSPVPAVRVHAPGEASRLRRLVFETHAPIQFLDITDQLAELVRVAGLREGLPNVFSRHPTPPWCPPEPQPPPPQ